MAQRLRPTRGESEERCSACQRQRGFTGRPGVRVLQEGAQRLFYVGAGGDAVSNSQFLDGVVPDESFNELVCSQRTCGELCYVLGLKWSMVLFQQVEGYSILA
ncbi:hypothetical protein MRX96_032611 [Rhipicephalus microplus]